MRRLLTHTSGVVDYTDAAVDFRRDYTEDELRRAAYKLGLDFRRERAGATATRATCCWAPSFGRRSGRFYGELLKERVFDPLGMNTARVISEADIVPHRAAGYRLEGTASRTRSGSRRPSTRPPTARCT